MELKKFRVSIVTEAGFIVVHNCVAKDENHAKKQATDAYHIPHPVDIRVEEV